MLPPRRPAGRMRGQWRGSARAHYAADMGPGPTLAPPQGIAAQGGDPLDFAHRLQGALFRISEVAHSGRDIGDILARVHEEVSHLMVADNFFVMLWDSAADTVVMPYYVDIKDTSLPRMLHHPVQASELPNSIAVRMMRQGRPMLGSWDELCRKVGIDVDKSHGPPSTAWLGVPMRRGDMVTGAVVVQSYDHSVAYDEDSLRLLEYVAQHLQMAMDRRKSRDELEASVVERTGQLSAANLELQGETSERQRAEALQRALFRLSELSSAHLGTDRFFAEVHSIVGRLVDSSNFYVALTTDDQHLDFVYVVDEHESVPRRSPRSGTLTDLVIAAGKPLLLDSAMQRQLEREGKVQLRGILSSSWLGVPLRRDNTVIGALVVQSYTPEVTFDERDMELLMFAGQQVGGSLARRNAMEQLEARVLERTQELARSNRALLSEIAERIRAEDRLQHQAHHDSLTGLANRRQLIDRLAQALHSARSSDDHGYAVLYLDMDQFKLVNDSMGHASGDLMLMEVARRLKSFVGPDDLVVRLGGDEFAILAGSVHDQAEGLALAQRLILAFEAPIQIHDRELFMSASIGIALGNAGYVSGEELLRDADAAMYRAKARGRSQCMVFDDAMRIESVRLLDLEADLRRGIINDAFEVSLQPIVRLADRSVVGQEALVRWHHEQQGILLPSEFIGVGEDSGLIQEVDWLVYRKVAEWVAEHPDGYVSINVSPMHFRSGEFAQRLLGEFDALGADPARLRIEITEIALLEENSHALDLLNQLRERGVMAMLDDFGTGYSALSYLRRFPLQCLKIDRSFTAGLDDPGDTRSPALMSAILTLARSLGIQCVAEGVETEAQAAVLRAQGCEFAQGYLFGRPEPMKAEQEPVTDRG